MILNGSVGDLCNIFEIIALESVMFAEVIDVKNVFYVFYSGHVFYVFNFFLFCQRFYF